MSGFPYASRFPVNRSLPEEGLAREEVLATLAAMAREEDAAWEVDPLDRHRDSMDRCPRPRRPTPATPGGSGLPSWSGPDCSWRSGSRW